MDSSEARRSLALARRSLALAGPVPTTAVAVHPETGVEEWTQAEEWLPGLMQTCGTEVPVPADLCNLIASYTNQAWTREAVEQRLKTSPPPPSETMFQERSVAATYPIPERVPQTVADSGWSTRLLAALFNSSYWLTLRDTTREQALWVLEEVIPERELLQPGAMFHTRCVWLEAVDVDDDDLGALLKLFEQDVMPRTLWLGLSGTNIRRAETLERITQMRLNDKLTSLEWLDISDTPLSAAMSVDIHHPAWRSHKILNVLGTSLRLG